MGAENSPSRTADEGAGLLIRWLGAWVDFVQRHAKGTIALTLGITLAFGFFATSRIGFNVDPNALFSKDLPFQKMIHEFERYFPVLTNSLLIVIDGESPEATRDAQERLAAELAKRDDVFTRIFLPGEEPFFESHALLYLDPEELEDFADEMARLQPVLGKLSQDPSLPTLADVIQLGLEELEVDDRDGSERWTSVLDRISHASEALDGGRAETISWEEVLLEDSGIDPITLRVIVLDPILDLERVLAAERAIDTVRETVAALGLEESGRVRVRTSGYPALNHEEMLGLASDTTYAGILSFVLVVGVLQWAFRSARVVLAAAITLVVALVWSAAFAGATVSVLNPLSITFGVLVIGLGIDFIIHFAIHFTSAIRRGDSVPDALQTTIQETGPALVLCGATTTVGFLAFVPTDYRGVSDLGLLASGGVLASLFLTLTLLPALLRFFLSDSARNSLARSSYGRALPIPIVRRPVWALAVAIVAGGISLSLLDDVELDTNVIRIRNPNTESVLAFEDLLASPEATPWYLDALTPSLEAADRLADTLRDRPGIDRVVTLSDYLPEDQDLKLEILTDVAMLLDLRKIEQLRPVDPDESVASLEELREALLTFSQAQPTRSPLTESSERLATALEERIQAAAHDPDSLSILQSVLLDTLPDQLHRLDTNLSVDSLTRKSLPEGLVSRMAASDGHARVQVYPAEELWNDSAMVDFVESVRPLWGDITGLPVNLVASADATWTSLREAMAWATGAIVILLLLLWRRIGDTLIALCPLLLAVMLTQVSTLFLPVSFSFVNVMVLPLLLGIGIDGGIHIVYRAHRHGESDLHTGATTQAVWYSALTTIASFGSLMISAHRGVASLGYLLVIGMLWVLVANLILLPALLRLRTERRLG